MLNYSGKERMDKSSEAMRTGRKEDPKVICFVELIYVKAVVEIRSATQGMEEEGRGEGDEVQSKVLPGSLLIPL